MAMRLGRLADVGLALREQASFAAVTQEVLKTGDIEGEVLNVASVRSSIARRMGLDIGALVLADRHVQGVACFWPGPTGARSVFTAYRRKFSASAMTTRPFSSALRKKGTLDVSAWLSWFLATLARALDSAQTTVDTVLFKARFWQRWAGTPFNQRQVKLISRLLDGWEGKLTSSKWAAKPKCSPDSALRDITYLLALGLLKKASCGGRSTSYELAIQPEASLSNRPQV
jgi:Fic family protein